MCRQYSRGTTGENKVIKILNKLNKGRYRTFNNIVIEYNGKQVEIDHLIISNFGIYIIETKNMSGKIKGNIEDKHWIKIKDKVEKFYNPINQNEIHIKAFKHIVQENIVETIDIPIYSLVVFINNTNIETDACNVINDKELIGEIYKLNKKSIDIELCEKLIALLV